MKNNAIEILKRILWFSRRKENGCLICYMSINSEGRPTILIDGKQYYVSRIIMHLLKDFDLSSNQLFVLHKDEICNSKACIEFDHLKIGTRSENVKDVVKKYGTASGGSTNRGYRKAFCSRGHERTSENLGMNGQCLICQRSYNAKRRIK